MQVFVLCTGRCGSTTFYKACSHFTNYTAHHESRVSVTGLDDRLDYPSDHHIEVDNRLSWFLGPLGARYGDRPLYVHLVRDEDAVVQSFMHRWGGGIIQAFSSGIACKRKRRLSENEQRQVCQMYVRTVNANIAAFLEGKPFVFRFQLEDYARDFPAFVELIQARGNMDLAMFEFTRKHNKSPGITPCAIGA